jgi:hypothetical protein
MLKRLLIGFLLLAALGAVAVYLFQFKNKPVPEALYKAVPLDAGWIVEIRSFDGLQQQLQLSDSSASPFARIPFLREVYRQLKTADSLRKANPQMRVLLSGDEPILVSGYSGNNVLYLFRLGNEDMFRSIDEFIAKQSKTTFDYSISRYENKQIVTIFNKTDSSRYSYAWQNGIFMLSTSSILLESAIRQLSLPTTIMSVNDFEKIHKTSGKSALANIYINLDKVPEWVKKTIPDESESSLRMFGSLGSWVELDFTAKPGIFIFNGFTFPHPIKPGIDGIFRGQQPVNLEVFNKLPATTNAFIVLGISDFNKYLQAYRQFSEQKNGTFALRDSFNTLQSKYDIDLESQFQGLFENEACLAFANFSGDTLSNKVYSLIRINNRETAENVLNSLVTEYANAKGLKTSEFISEQPHGQMLPLKIWNIPFGNVPALLFGSMFNAGANCYCTLLDNYLLFGNDPDALIRYIQTLQDKKYLSNDQSFVDFSEYFSLQSNFFFYNKPQLSEDFYPQFLSANVIKKLGLDNVSQSPLEALVFQFSSSPNLRIYNNLFFKFKTAPSLNPSTGEELHAKTVTLDAAAVTPPFILNFSKNSERTVFVQDSLKQIYLIDSLQRIIWKQKISETVVGNVYQINAFRNRNQQILFASRNYIWLIDRKGNPVEGFPVKLKSTTNCGMSVFDYDRNKKYRILVSCNDKKIYCYDVTGKLVTGWNFGRTVSPLKQPLRLFTIGNKDFIVGTDTSRLYILDRQGKEIAKTSARFSPSTENPVYLINGRSLKEARFVVSDKHGLVRLVSVTGQTSTIDVGSYPPVHQFNVFDFDNDGVKDFAFSWGNSLKIFSQNKQVLFQTSVSCAYSPSLIVFEQKAFPFRLGITSTCGNVYLFNSTGKQPVGFPVAGNSQIVAEVFNNQENPLYLVVSSNKQTLLYYTVP